MITISYSDSSDGRIRSTSASYSSALSGSGLTVDTTTSNFGTWGQWNAGSYVVFQYFVRFPYTLDADQQIVSAYFEFTGSTSTGPETDRRLEILEYNWGTSLTTGDWRTAAQLSALTRLARLSSAQGVGNGQILRCGSDGLLSRLGTTGEVRAVLVSDRQRDQTTPSGAEYSQFRTADYGGTASDPALVYTSVPVSTLDRYLGAQAALSDGTAVVLEHNAVAYPSNTILLRHHDGSSATTIATISNNVIGSDTGRGAQSATVVVDSSDNIYVIGRAGFTSNSLAVLPYLKGSGYSWTAGTARTGGLSARADAQINNVAATWHGTGTGGTIAVVVSHSASFNSGVEISYVLLNCGYLLGGSGSLFRDSGSAYSAGLVRNVPSAGFHNFQNETGTLMDICAAPSSALRGWFLCTDRQHLLGVLQPLSLVRYQLVAGGTGIASVAVTESSSDGSPAAVKDANAKARVVGISGTECVVVAAGNTAGTGITVSHWQNFGSSSQVNKLSEVRLSAEGLSTLPEPSVSAVSNNWDTVYDAAAGLVWVYYFDQADGQRLMKTSVDLYSGLASQNENEATSAAGASGSTNHAIRTVRGVLPGRQVLVSAANETGGGTHSMLYIADQLNVAPSQPTLVPRSNFDARLSAEFEWTFNDPGDTQSAYQLQINTSVGATAYDTGKTSDTDNNHTLPASSLTNPEDWQWRVRTWDSLDEAGPYSEYGSFSTSASGTVTITNPAADNPDDVTTEEFLVIWAVDGTTQVDYRVVVVRTSDSAELLNTGWVTSTDTEYEVTGMQTETEYRVEVTIRNGSAVETNTATRLITPNYTNPPTPAVALTAMDNQGYVEVAIDNPAAGETFESLADGSFETGVADWEINGGTLTQTSAFAFEGSFSGQILVTGGPSETTVRTTSGNLVEVVPGRQYTVNFQAYAPSGYSHMARTIDWLDGGEVLLSSSENASELPSAAWTDIRSTFYAPSGAELANYGPTLSGSPADGTAVYVDELLFLSGSDQPAPTVNEVYRREPGGGFILVGTAELNSVFRDYTARAGVAYEYLVRSVADTRYADSEVATLGPVLMLAGVWIHNPDDPQATVYNFQFGKAARATGLEIPNSSHYYAGRTHPVTDYGEHQTETYRATVDIPFGEVWADEVALMEAFALSRQVLVFRDNRGRGATGTISGYSSTDQLWGTQASFTFTRNDVVEVSL